MAIKKQKSILIIIIIIVIFLIISAIVNSNNKKIVKVKGVKVTKTSITGYVYANGILHYKNIENIGVGIDGYLRKLYKKRGEYFKKNDIVLEISDSSLLKGLYFNFLKKKMIYQNTKKEYEVNKTLYKKNIISKQTLNNIYLKYIQSKVDYENHQYWDYKQIGFYYNKKRNTFYYKPNFNGILLDINYDEGDKLLKDKPIIIITHGKQMIAEFNVNILDSQKVKLNNVVKITSDILPKLILSGRISSISLNPKKYGQTNVIKVYAKVNIDNILPNDIPIDGKIIYMKKNNILKIPIESLRERYSFFYNKKTMKRDDKNYYPYFVYVIKKKDGNVGVIEKKLVKIGLQNDFYVEITKGLKEGEIVINYSEKPLFKGEEVKYEINRAKKNNKDL